MGGAPARAEPRTPGGVLAGVEQKWREAFGRWLTAEELQGILREYPGDLPETPQALGDNRARSLVGTVPLFHGKAVLIDYSPGVRNPRILRAQIRGLVRRLEDAHATEDELIVGIHERIAEHDGLGRS
jgi:hypothetical protein